MGGIKAKKQNETLRHLKENIPSELIDFESAKSLFKRTKFDENDQKNDRKDVKNVKLDKNGQIDDEKSKRNDGIDKLKNDFNNNKKRQIVGKQRNSMGVDDNCVFRIDRVSEKEYKKVPNHMRSNLSLDRINNAISEADEILTRKYSLLLCQEKRLSKRDLLIRKGYQEQENKETKGHKFFMGSDLKKAAYLRVSTNTGRRILNILRHLERLKILPGSSHRYAFVD